MGFSTVSTFLPRRSREVRPATRVVDLPEPVGPVSSRMPKGSSKMRARMATSSCRKPRAGKLKLARSWESRRMTMFSPKGVTMEETRMS